MTSTPEVKILKPITFLFHRIETTIQQLEQALPVGQQLIREAVQQGLTVTGCVHWHYFDFTGNEIKKFTLEVALPIAQPLQPYNGQFKVKTTGDFKCVCLTHEGRWDEIPMSYGRMMDFMKANHLASDRENRELYVNADFINQQGNITELQLGIL